MTGLGNVIAVLGDRNALKKEVEVRASGLSSNLQVLGFKHLDVEVTPVRADFFREAMVEMLGVSRRSRCPPPLS